MTLFLSALSPSNIDSHHIPSTRRTQTSTKTGSWSRSPPKFIITCSFYHPGLLHKISSQSIGKVLSNVANRQTNRQTNTTENNLLAGDNNSTQCLNRKKPRENCISAEHGTDHLCHQPWILKMVTQCLLLIEQWEDWRRKKWKRRRKKHTHFKNIINISSYKQQSCSKVWNSGRHIYIYECLLINIWMNRWI